MTTKETLVGALFRLPSGHFIRATRQFIDAEISRQRLVGAVYDPSPDALTKTIVVSEAWLIRFGERWDKQSR